LHARSGWRPGAPGNRALRRSLAHGFGVASERPALIEPLVDPRGEALRGQGIAAGPGGAQAGGGALVLRWVGALAGTPARRRGQGRHRRAGRLAGRPGRLARRLQRWTGLLLPPELVGSHVGPERAHTTGRRTDLGFRCATALFGHAGLEWNLLSCTPAEVDELAAWIRLYRRLRPLLHAGEVVRADHPDPSVWLHGVVAEDRRHAVFAVVQLATSAEVIPARLRLSGLDPAASYLVRACAELPPPEAGATAQPSWLSGGGVGLPGRVLATVGLPAPMLQPAQAAVFEVAAAPPA
jgi:hypothetical protein